MANVLYDKGREKFLRGEVSWNTHNIKAVLVQTAGGYTVNTATHEFLSSILVGNRVATSANLASKTTTDGIANAANITFTAVTGNVCGAVVIYRDTGNPTTDPLIAYIDTAGSLPATPNGTDITITWDTGVNKIFKL